MKKYLKVADLREVMDSHEKGEITFSRAVEMLNEKIDKEVNDHLLKMISVFK